ncbi:MAG: hypothetical protein E6X17_16970 [Sporomusaceae bacterium]|nr:hypothetical protein [Sporomusaceae bacterium]
MFLFCRDKGIYKKARANFNQPIALNPAYKNYIAKERYDIFMMKKERPLLFLKIGSWVKAEWDLLLRKPREEGLSIRPIERVTGILRGVVAKS